jgi:hypothetical protein
MPRRRPICLLPSPWAMSCAISSSRRVSTWRTETAADASSTCGFGARCALRS